MDITATLIAHDSTCSKGDEIAFSRMAEDKPDLSDELDEEDDLPLWAKIIAVIVFFGSMFTLAYFFH